MKDQNLITLTGRLTVSPESKFKTVGENNTPLLKISIACNDRIKKAGEWLEDADFINLEIWGRNAQFVRDFVYKGQRLQVEGRLKIDPYETDTGERKYYTYVKVEKVFLIEPKDKKPDAVTPETVTPEVMPTKDETDEVPF